ncbi:MAG TPA: hypothetical protein VL326_01565 [Kofleriaceae bacterium]|jgi:hypothetical protein|nr:hypothetical protein [Kofleriaceae bacterium]
MKLSKLLLLVPTLWVLIYCSGPLVDLDLGTAVNWATTGLWGVLLVTYWILVWSNRSFVMTTSKRVLWTLGLLLFGPVAMPIYFVIHVLPEQTAAS